MPGARPARVAAALAVVSLWLWLPTTASASVFAAASSDGPVTTLPTPSATPPSPPQVMLDETAAVSEEAAVLGGVARLPCDLRPPARGDQVALVIWYKGGAASPIYSLDARGRSVQQQPTHWADERTLGGRSFFRVDDADEDEEQVGVHDDEDGEVRGTHLAIESVREADGGSYRCRVDFRRSPARNAIVNLTVIVPPQNLTLLNEEGREIEGASLGPFAEGASTVVRCIAEGGRPLPQVSWWRDGAPLAAEEDVLQAQTAFAQSTLRVGPLARADLGSELQCRAANSDLVPPLRRSLAIDLLHVRGRGRNVVRAVGDMPLCGRQRRP